MEISINQEVTSRSEENEAIVVNDPKIHRTIAKLRELLRTFDNNPFQSSSKLWMLGVFNSYKHTQKTTIKS